MDVSGTYYVHALTYGVLALSLLAIRATTDRQRHAQMGMLRSLGEGFSYVRANPVIGSLLLIEAVTSIFGYFQPMMVVFARDVFELGPEGLGVLQSAAGVGTLFGSVALAAMGDIRYKGPAVIASGVIYAAAVAAFAFVPIYWLALVLLVLSGAADTWTGAIRNTMLQLAVRREMLGRVMSLHAITTRGLSNVGGFQAGALASVIGVHWAVGAGAGICGLAILAVGLLVREVREFTDEEASAVNPS